MPQDLEYWKTKYYEQQASHTESNGMLTDERNRAVARMEAADLLLKMEKARLDFLSKPDVSLDRRLEDLYRSDPCVERCVYYYVNGVRSKMDGNTVREAVDAAMREYLKATAPPDPKPKDPLVGKMVDPPSGWKYGFPKQFIPRYEGQHINEWLQEQGVPQSLIDLNTLGVFDP